MSTTQTPTRRTRLASALALPVLLLALAACTSGTEATGSPSSAGGTTAGQPATDAEMSAARDDYDRRLAECFRGQGLDVQDPQPGQGITEDTPEIRDAYPGCVAEIGDPPSSEGRTFAPEDVARALEQARCLRELGYEIQEPTADDIGFVPAEVSDEDFETCRTD
jgi:hypothetical protein